jgi:hypothetical protein
MNSKTPYGRVPVALLALVGLALVSFAQSVRAASKLSSGQHTAEVNGIKFAYFVAGRGPLLIVQSPGWGIGSQVLRNGLKPLETSFTLVCYDPRGSGLSSRPSDETKMSTSNMVDPSRACDSIGGLGA